MTNYVHISSFITNLVYIHKIHPLGFLCKLMQATAEVFILKQSGLLISKTFTNSYNINSTALIL